jgi:putative FmdB family regulatory protein
MAIYEYRCTKCKHEFEFMKPISRADEPEKCPQCGGQGQKLTSVFASGESYKIRVPEKDAFRGITKKPAKGKAKAKA